LNLMLTVLQMALEDAMWQGWVVCNVARRVDRVPQTKREMQTFAEGDVRNLLKAADSDRLEAAWHLALSGLHDVRHTCATLMHLRGVPVAVIAAWLGHIDAAFTMRTYVHSQNDALRSAASVMNVVTSA